MVLDPDAYFSMRIGLFWRVRSFRLGAVGQVVKLRTVRFECNNNVAAN